MNVEAEQDVIVEKPSAHHHLYEHIDVNAMQDELDKLERKRAEVERKIKEIEGKEHYLTRQKE